MKKLRIFLAMTVIALLAIPVNAADGQYKGGAGDGSAMAECVGRRLDDIKKPKSNDGAKSQYSGGSGSGSAFGEYAGRLDGGKRQM